MTLCATGGCPSFSTRVTWLNTAITVRVTKTLRSPVDLALVVSSCGWTTNNANIEPIQIFLLGLLELGNLEIWGKTFFLVIDRHIIIVNSEFNNLLKFKDIWITSCPFGKIIRYSWIFNISVKIYSFLHHKCAMKGLY